MNQKAINTESVVKQHINAFLEAGSVEKILLDYDSNAIFITPDRIYKGIDEIKLFLQNFIESLPENITEKFKLGTMNVQGDIALITWKIENYLSMGVDTFVIKNGKIVSQTVALYK